MSTGKDNLPDRTFGPGRLDMIIASMTDHLVYSMMIKRENNKNVSSGKDWCRMLVLCVTNLVAAVGL